jgi:hypothetical protein
MKRRSRQSSAPKAARKGERLMSLENEQWPGLRKAADAVLNQILCQKYRELGIAYVVTEFSVRIAAYTREHILHNSSGAQSVVANLAKRGLTPETASAQQKQVANHVERRNKRMFPLANFNDMWRARNVDAGFPVFEPGDKRLEQGFVLTPAMSPAQAIDAGLAWAAGRDERVYDERKLLEAAIKGSAYATPHADISLEIERQLASLELVFHRGALVHPSAEHRLDAHQSRTMQLPVSLIMSLDAGLDHLESSTAGLATPLSQPERDGVLSFVAGESRETAISTTLLGQPAVLAAIHAAALASNRDVVQLLPLSSQAGPDQRSVESAVEGRAPLCTPRAVVVLHHAQDSSARVRQQLAAKAQACDARVVHLYDPGHEPVLVPPLQTTERALRAQVEPFRDIRAQQEKQLQSGQGGNGLVLQDNDSQVNDCVVGRASELLSRGEPVLVLTTDSKSAGRLNTEITTALANLSGVPETKARARKMRPVADAKAASSYAVGDAVMVKRKTGQLHRKEIARIESINAKAGFLTLSVSGTGKPRSVVMSLATQSHHIALIDVQDLAIVPGALLRSDSQMHTLGLGEGQVLTVDSVESGSVHLHGASGSAHCISLHGSPLQMSPAMAMSADELSVEDRIQARASLPEVLVHLEPGASREQVGATLAAAYSMSTRVETHATRDVLDRDLPAPSLLLAKPALELAVTREQKLRVARLMVREEDTPSLQKLHAALQERDGSSPLHVTLTRANGTRQLHRITDTVSAARLGAKLERSIQESKQKTPVKAPEPTRSALPSRPLSRELDH